MLATTYNMHCLEIGPMSSKRVAIFTDGNLGGTFLDWSLHWLTGQEQYWSWQRGEFVPLTANPMQGSTAHAHHKNHPEGLKQVKELMEAANTVDHLVSFYVMPRQHDLIAGPDLSKKETMQKVLHQRQVDYAKAISWCANNGVTVVQISCPETYALYHAFNRVEAQFLERLQPDVPTEERFWRVFFKDSLDDWHNRGLTNIWDKREFIALNLRPYDQPELFKIANTKDYRFEIQIPELWYNGHLAIQTLIGTLGLNIVGDRWREWNTAYSRWRMIQLPILDFVYELPRIVSAIVYGQRMPLKEMTLLQEAMIQHCLIYQHRLNLRTWNLTHFPNNTLELHQLLEPNRHRLRV